MAVSAEHLSVIEAVLGEPAPAREIVAELRRRCPGLLVTQVDAADLDGQRPYRAWPHVELHLLDRSAHCWRLTGEPECATGLVLATPLGAP